MKVVLDEFLRLMDTCFGATVGFGEGYACFVIIHFLMFALGRSACPVSKCYSMSNPNSLRGLYRGLCTGAL